MKKVIILLILPLLAASCSPQMKEESIQQSDVQESNKMVPKADIRVNKTYDENGNLLSYDSSYSWSYRSPSGDSTIVNVDSLMSDFYPYMRSKQHTFSPYFRSDLFYNDSLFYNDFLGHDYFTQRWENHIDRMNRMMLEMDSIKMQFFGQRYPGLYFPDTLSN